MTRPEIPSSIEAEESVIGGVLVHSSKWNSIAYLRPEDFSHVGLRAIFEAMIELAAAKKPIDQLTVTEQMRALDTFEKLRTFKGADYLLDLMAKVVTVENIGHHARIVRDKAIARKALDLATAARRALLDGEHGPDVAEVFGQRLAQLASASGTAPKAAITSAASIPIARVDWVWRGRIAAGMINILDGDPGLGKSSITTDLAARISRGAPMPGEEHAEDPASVILVSMEEHAGAVMVPRLMAADAALERVMIWDIAARPFDLVSSLAELGDLIRHHRARLVVIDPLMAALPPELNAHRDQDVRSVLAPVAGVAESTGAAFLFVRHLNKSGGGSAIYRGGGSIGIVGAARCGLMLGREEGEEESEADDGRRVLATVKCNVARTAPTLSLRLVPAPSPAPGVEVARVEWGGVSRTKADELVQPDEDRGAMAQAMRIVRELVKDGPIAATEAEKALKAHGISERTGRRARQRLRVDTKKGIKGWWWHPSE